jgi:hypothetical protein
MAAAMSLPLLMSSQAMASSDEQWQEELGGSDGQGVKVQFTFPGSWKLDRKPGTLIINEEARIQCTDNPDCIQGDVFSRSPGGDSAFLTLATPDEALEKIPFTFFKKQIFNRGGKFGKLVQKSLGPELGDLKHSVAPYMRQMHDNSKNFILCMARFLSFPWLMPPFPQVTEAALMWHLCV